MSATSPDHVPAHGAIADRLADPVAGLEPAERAEQDVRRQRVDRQLRQLRRVAVLADRDDVASSDYDLVGPGALLPVGDDEHSSADEVGVDSCAGTDHGRLGSGVCLGRP
jgi:hypothetical protein